MACLLKITFLITTVLSAGYAYYPDIKDTFIPDDILRDLLDSITEEASDEYDDSAFGKLPPSLGFLARAQKDQTERMMDYDSILERTNPHPSLRDEEHTQHSSLWGYQFMSGGAGEGKIFTNFEIFFSSFVIISYLHSQVQTSSSHKSKLMLHYQLTVIHQIPAQLATPKNKDAQLILKTQQVSHANIKQHKSVCVTLNTCLNVPQPIRNRSINNREIWVRTSGNSHRNTKIWSQRSFGLKR